MKTLAIDIETFSSVNLLKSGVYAYAESDDFEILLFAYAIDDEEVQIVDLSSNEKLPDKIINALDDDNIIKTAFNANFERICISKYLNRKLSPKSWHCTQVQSLILGLPLSLDKVGEVLNVNSKKMKEGKDLIKFFTIPCNPTEKNNFQKRNMPKELIKDFIGKVCSISIFNDSFGVCGKIVAVEDNWIKVVPYRSKTEIKLINGDMIRDISVMPDKYQNKV